MARATAQTTPTAAVQHPDPIFALIEVHRTAGYGGWA